MNASFISLANALGWTIIHSLWQGALIFIILKGLLGFFRRMPSRMRYLLSSLALWGILIGVSVTFARQWQSRQESLPFFRTDGWVLAAPPIGAAGSPATGETASFPFIHILPVVDVLYFIGLLFFLGKFVRDLIALRFIKKRRTIPFDPAWENYLKKLSGDWGISRQVKLFLSGSLAVPIVVGYLKPVIYLPVTMATDLAPDQLEAILLHELAHIKRNDFLINIIQSLAEVVLFFNPFVWWISRSMRIERENSCDDLVVSVARPRLYAETLLAISENILRTGGKRAANGKFALAAAQEKQELFLRIKRMMETKTKKLNVMQRLLVFVMLLGGVFSIAWLAPGETAGAKRTPAGAGALLQEAAKPALSPDTSLPAPPLPPSPPDPSSHPAPPPAPEMNMPPPPPAPPKADSLMGDSIAPAAGNRQLSDYHGPEWEKYQQQLQDYGKKMSAYFNGAQWKTYQQAMAEYVRQMTEELAGPEWEKYRSQMAQWAQAIAKENQDKFTYFQHDAWKYRSDSLNHALMADRSRLDSLLAVANRKRQEAFTAMRAAGHFRLDSLLREQLPGKDAPAGFAQVNRLVDLIKSDGLLSNEEEYRIKINQNGLYINGKKQDQKYFEKYKRLIGDTRLDIKRNNNQLQLKTR